MFALLRRTMMAPRPMQYQPASTQSSRWTLTALAFACLASATACGGTVEVGWDGEEQTGATGGLTPPDAGGLQLLAGPSLIAPGLGLARLAVRSGHFEMVGGRDDTHELWAGRVVAAPGSITVGTSTVVQSNHGNTPSLSVADDTLILCGNAWSADPTQIMELDAGFVVTRHRTLPGNSAGCQGAAFANGRGLMAVHRSPPQGCCSRQVLYDYDDIGIAPSEALPPTELNPMSLVSLGSRFLWAALVENETMLSVTLSPDGAERETFRYPVLDGAVGYRRPDVQVDREMGQALIAVGRDQGPGQVFVVAADGSLQFERQVGDPAMEPRRPSVAVGPSSFLVAWAECSPGTDNGEVIVESFDATGTLDRLEIQTACTSVGDVAVSGDRGLITWGTEQGTMAAAFTL